jgi:hypothetical protein
MMSMFGQIKESSTFKEDAMPNVLDFLIKNNLKYMKPSDLDLF